MKISYTVTTNQYPFNVEKGQLMGHLTHSTQYERVLRLNENRGYAPTHRTLCVKWCLGCMGKKESEEKKPMEFFVTSTKVCIFTDLASFQNICAKKSTFLFISITFKF